MFCCVTVEEYQGNMNGDEQQLMNITICMKEYERWEMRQIMNGGACRIKGSGCVL